MRFSGSLFACVLIFGLSIPGVAACFAQDSDQTEAETPEKVTFQQVLMTAELKMYPTFADVNGDSKPDLFIGSKGHTFEAKTGKLQRGEAIEMADLTLHLNLSDGNDIKFDEPSWPKMWSERCDLPGG